MGSHERGAPPTTGSTILFDGVCNLCERSVLFVIERDRAAYFRLASLQSEAGERIAQQHGIDAAALESIVLIEDGRVWRQSDAALRIARKLDGAWPLLALLQVVPRFIRDRVYARVAANRYRWFGRKDSCMVPTPELRARFLDADESPTS
jgi:predicted DCC family thiol-disulfide oxidoreductase YuxK